MELKWLGHASWKIKTSGMIIYLDPYEGEMDEPADLILASHSHDDHYKPEAAKKVLTLKTIVVAPQDCSQKIGANVRSLKPGEKAKFEEVEIEGVEAYNVKRFRSPGVPFHPKGLGVGYLIKAEGKTVYNTGDTEFVPELKSLKDIDIAFMVTGGTYTMDSDEAVEMTLALKPKMVVPVHFWDTDPNIFKKNVESKSSTKVKILKPNETLSL
jgi:L-ascorbate metabolism protein UlaG (beta-lactamase superfamily)